MCPDTSLGTWLKNLGKARTTTDVGFPMEGLYQRFFVKEEF